MKAVRCNLGNGVGYLTSKVPPPGTSLVYVRHLTVISAKYLGNSEMLWVTGPVVGVGTRDKDGCGELPPQNKQWTKVGGLAVGQL